MATCPDCFNLRHHRCGGRRGCTCDVCRKNARAVRLPVLHSEVKKPPRVKKPAGAPRTVVTPEMLKVAVLMRKDGGTYRAIAEAFGLKDHSGLARHIKRELAKTESV